MKPTATKFSSRPFHSATAILCSYLVAIYPVRAQQEQQAQSAVQQTVTNESDLEAPKIPDEQLDSLVAPIALYPDPLLAQTLAAATYPLEMIQLQQWLAKNPDLKGKALADAVQKQNWDPSIQATAALPEVVKLLSEDITWTTDLGNAFLSQQSDVMDAVQRMRMKAQGKGALQTSQQQVVKSEQVEGKSVIVVQQADPDVVYVPSYNPTVVYGAPAYPYPSIYYPPVGAYVAGAAIAFGVGVAIGNAWHGGWGWGCGWGRNDINVNVHNNYVNNYNRRNNINANNNNWQHHPQHRGGAPYGNRATANRYGAKVNTGNRINTGGNTVNIGGNNKNRVNGGSNNNQINGGNNRNNGNNRLSQGGQGDRQRPGQGQAGNRPSQGGGGERQRPGQNQAGNRPSQGNRKPSTAGNRAPSHTSGANQIGNRNVSKPSSGRSKSAFGSGGGSRSSASASHSRGSRSMGGGGGHKGGGRRR